jgi:zinc transport system ATP-binding protein
MKPIIEVRGVSFAYSNLPTLENISLSINKGDYAGIIGPNGGGKTTLIKLILGLLEPQTGKIYLWGKPIKSFNQWHKIGYVPQRVNNNDYRLPITVEEVVTFGCSTKSRFKRWSDLDRETMRWAMQEAGVASLAKRPLTSLSAGQQQKVFIAKALASKPEILILDEPTVGVDVRAQDEFYQLISELNKKEELTIIMVSHDIDVVVNEVSKLVCINETLVYHGNPKGFMKKDYLTQLHGKTRKFILHGH